jgi:prepilin-type N-terminal cleavage/methylation domain-containing protein
MLHSPSRQAFTLIEMITVIAIIAILTGLILSINGLVQRKAATARTETEIKTLSAACEAYKTDNGGYPQDPTPTISATDSLDPALSANPANYANASLYLYKALTGDLNANGTIDKTTNVDTDESGKKNYAPDFFKASRLGGVKTNGVVNPVQYIMDPFGNSYGYSTAGLKAEQDFRAKLATDPTATRIPAGYNSTFDLWSTGGQTSSSGTAKWIKNW